MSANTTASSAGSAQQAKFQPWKAHSRAERSQSLVNLILSTFDTVVSSDLVITKAQPEPAGHRYLTTAAGVALVDVLAQSETAEFSDLLATDESNGRGD